MDTNDKILDLFTIRTLKRLEQDDVLEGIRRMTGKTFAKSTLVAMERWFDHAPSKGQEDKRNLPRNEKIEQVCQFYKFPRDRIAEFIDMDRLRLEKRHQSRNQD